MGKTNGGTRNGVGGIANSTPENKAEENEIKRSLAENRESLVSSIKETRMSGKVGELVNSEIDRAKDNIENALKQMEDAGTVNDVYEANSNLHRVVRSSVSRLSYVAELHEHNMGYSQGRTKNTLQKAADALRSTAYEITKIIDGSGKYGLKELMRLEDIFRSQNRWK